MWSSLLDEYDAYGLPYYLNIMAMAFPIKDVAFPIQWMLHLWSFPLSIGDE
jgi:hypothetical protein